MLRLLRRLFGRTQTDRFIFPYRDGAGGRRRADPLAVQRALEEKGGNWQGLLAELSVETAMAGKKDLSPDLAAQMNRAPQIIGELAGAVRAAFQVPAFDDHAGLTDLECLDLLADYLTWLREVELDCLPLSSSPRPGSASRPASSEDTAEWSPFGPPATASASPNPSTSPAASAG